MSVRRRDISSPPRGVGGKLRMETIRNHTRITDPSLPAGKRKEIDNVMKKARAFPNDGTWDKKLLEVEEKDPNRWRHTGYKKMYIEGDVSSDSEDERRSRSRSKSRSLSRLRRTPPSPIRRRSPPSPVSPRRRSPPANGRKMPMPQLKRRPRSPEAIIRRKSPELRRRSPMIPISPNRRRMSPVPKGRPMPRRPPSPPPKATRSPSSCSESSCSACSGHGRFRSRSRSLSMPRSRPVRSPPVSPSPKHVRPQNSAKIRERPMRPMSPPTQHLRRKEMVKVPRMEKIPPPERRPPPPQPERRPVISPTKEISPTRPRSSKHKLPTEEYPRPAKVRPQKPPEPSSPVPIKKKDKPVEKLRARVKIEGEKRRPRSPSSGSDDSSSSENSLPRFTATTRLTLSERFGKMAQWSADRSTMENMRITKNSAGGDLKVMIEEGFDAATAAVDRYHQPAAPQGHFPEELMTQGPIGLSSWDDVRVRYEYYKGRGYLRDLDLQDYIKWEEWWYKYQEWLKQERYYEMWERQMNHRRRKKIPITQRLN
uniref:Putative conserved protein with signal anchor n=1 Tax=Corethrella appendiculata TaxID=1370023 RepID=U5EMA5_9DIPT